MSKPLCKFFTLNQRCRFGKNCRFLHSLSEGPPLLLEELNKDDSTVEDNHHSSKLSSTNLQIHQQSTTIKQNDVPVNTISESASSGRNQSEISPAIHDDARSVKVQTFSGQRRREFCEHLARFGNCHYGKNCRFSHEFGHREDSSHPRHRYLGKNNRPIARESPQLGRAEVPPRFKEKKCQEVEDRTENVVDTSLYTADKNEHLRSLESHSGSQQIRIRENRTGRRICKFFLTPTGCYKKEQCRFFHPPDLLLSDENVLDLEDRPRCVRQPELPSVRRSNGSKEPVTSVGSSSALPRTPCQRPTGLSGLKQVFTSVEVEEVGVHKLRDSEKDIIKKRFTKDKITIIEDGIEFSARIQFKPTDPDWPFDVDVFELLLTLPADYPKTMMSIKLPNDQDLPETLRRYVEVTIGEWLLEKKKQLTSCGKVELIFRPFLRWLDRNMEDIVTEALQQLKREMVAKAAGMEFLSAQQLKAKYEEKSNKDDGETTSLSASKDDDEEDAETSSSGGFDSGSDEESSSNEDDLCETSQSLSLDPARKGTEIALRHLQLKENASALLFERLKIVLQCGRCKNHADLYVTQGKVVSLRCEKCNQNQFINYRAALIHQFSSIVGFLDVDGCQAFDVIFQECRVLVTCMGCNKQTRLDGLVTGQIVHGWCQACNASFKVATEAVKLSQLAPSGIDTSASKVVEVASGRSKKLPKDPAIKEGFPLPEFGTCKHYKHSYRWLRFPCCGKAYPCDVCHDKKEDHENIFATRMICGHCCKEQNFAGSRPCNRCNQHLTKVRSAHWEGGTGCRDTIAMSKSDQQKYRNLHKTISNHKKKVKSGGSSKKTTKLRHS